MVQGRFQGAVGLSLLELGRDLLADRGQVDGWLGGDSFGGGLLLSNLDSVVSFVPRLECVGINQDNGTLDERLGSDQLVVGGVVRDVEDTDLAGADFGSPGKVSLVQTERPKLGVSSSSTDLVDTCLADLGHGGGASHFVLALLLELGPASTGFTALVAAFASNAL